MGDHEVPEGTVADGFGGYWHRCHYEDCDLHVVRPGKVQCSNCDVEALRFDREQYREICKLLAGYFTSGNEIPVERATITANSELVTKLKKWMSLAHGWKFDTRPADETLDDRS